MLSNVFQLYIPDFISRYALYFILSGNKLFLCKLRVFVSAEDVLLSSPLSQNES